MKHVFHIVCAWCQTLMRSAGHPNARISHSICDTCFQKEFQAIQARRARETRTRTRVQNTPASATVG